MRTLVVFSGVAAACVVVIFLAGCEGEGTVALQIEPSYVDLSYTNSSATQTFTATGGLRELSLPLEWSVSNPSLGYIGAQGGYSASYIRTGASGNNSITVRDQYGAEGVATVKQ